MATGVTLAGEFTKFSRCKKLKILIRELCKSETKSARIVRKILSKLQTRGRNSRAIEIRFKNNWICNEILNNDRAHIAATCWASPQFPASFDDFSRNFHRSSIISSLNYTLDAKNPHQMHKLSSKSIELIPPAQHPVCSVLLNKFIFSLFVARNWKKKKDLRSCNEKKKYCVGKENKVSIHAACFKRSGEIFCERSIIVYWEFYSSSIIMQLFYCYAIFSTSFNCILYIFFILTFILSFVLCCCR